MNFLKVNGSYYEMGFQQGEYFAEDIKNSYQVLVNSNSFKIIKPNFIPTFLFSFLVKKIVHNKWRKPIEVLLPEYSQRIKGIADGAKADISDLYVLQSLEVMADDISYFVEKKLETSISCSSICILQNIFKSSQIIIGKNFDYLSEFNTEHIVRISKPKNGYKSIEITYKQLAGSHDGMNEKGLVVIYNYGLSIEKTQTRIPITILLQQLLERCANIDEALTFIKSFRYPNGAILTIADSSNRAICVELTPEHIGIRKPQDGILVATNHYLTELKNYEIPSDARLKSRNLPKELRGKRVHESSEKRYERIIEILKKKTKISLEDVEEILKDHNNQSQGDDNTVCRHGGYLSTQMSMIFLPKLKKVKVYYGNPCKNNFAEFEIE